jgi:hypothetical protein
MNRSARLLLVGTGALLLAGCGPQEPPTQRYRSDSFLFRVSSEPLPPYAREDITYKVTVREKDSNQPIENGEGRIFAESRDGKRTWGPLEPGPEVGTYYGKLNYLTAGEWAVGIQFRRDSTQQLERVDWMQEVRSERNPAVP